MSKAPGACGPHNNLQLFRCCGSDLMAWCAPKSSGTGKCAIILDSPIESDAIRDLCSSLQYGLMLDCMLLTCTHAFAGGVGARAQTIEGSSTMAAGPVQLSAALKGALDVAVGD